MNDELMRAPVVPRSAAKTVDGWKLFAFEYGAAAFLCGCARFSLRAKRTAGRAIEATYRGRAVSAPAFSVSFVLGNATLFNTASVHASGIACNRTYTALAGPAGGALGGWESWAQPLPPAGGQFLPA
jgi:hypothetical protein